ncbi:PAAR domain-containing protein [Pseudomonas sp. Marseille-QA0332]
MVRSRFRLHKDLAHGGPRQGGDPVSCPVCGITRIANGSHNTFLDHQPVALVGVSRTACSCSSVIISGLAWFHINDHLAAVQWQHDSQRRRRPCRFLCLDRRTRQCIRGIRCSQAQSRPCLL